LLTRREINYPAIFFRVEQACIDESLRDVKEVAKFGVTMRVLVEDLPKKGDGIRMNPDVDRLKGHPMGQLESIERQSFGSVQKSGGPLKCYRPRKLGWPEGMNAGIHWDQHNVHKSRDLFPAEDIRATNVSEAFLIPPRLRPQLLALS
jgi:hypothetical protein